jgi:hypothetical protein
MWGLSLALGVGIAFFRSRVCWWIWALFSAAAVMFTISTLWSSQMAARLGWPSWVNIGVQALGVALVFSPQMIRFIRPFGERQRLDESAG